MGPFGTSLLGGPSPTNSALLGNGGGIYNGRRGALTTTGVSGSPLVITGNTGSRGGGIAAVNSTATTLTRPP